MVMFPGDLTGLTGTPGTSIARPIHVILKIVWGIGGFQNTIQYQVVFFAVRSRVATVSTRTAI